MSIYTRRNALLGWIVWKLAKRRARKAVPEWPRAHPIATVAGISGVLAGATLAMALLGGDRRSSLVPRQVDARR